MTHFAHVKRTRDCLRRAGFEHGDFLVTRTVAGCHAVVSSQARPLEHAVAFISLADDLMIMNKRTYDRDGFLAVWAD